MTRTFAWTTVFPAIAVVATLSVANPAPVMSGVIVTPTTTSSDLATALNGTGLTITSVSIINGAAVQFGTYTDFNIPPITIDDGIVLSSGDVSLLGPPADPVLESPQPSIDTGTSGTAEFDAYGPGRIENFAGSFDVAALQIIFELDEEGQIQFDFVFGSVEYPYYTRVRFKTCEA